MLIHIILPSIFILIIIYFFLYKSSLLFFYSNKCSHCINFKSEWEKIKREINLTEDINCDINPEICNKYNIDAYPSIIKVNFFGISTEYRGKRIPEDIIKFYNE